MADIGINSLEDGRSGCDALKAASQQVDVARSEGASGFAVLTHCNPDLGSGFISELTSSLDDIYNFISNNLYSSADGYFQPEPEETVPEKIVSSGDTSRDGVYPATPSSPSSPSSPTEVTSPETTPQTTAPETTVPETTTPDTEPIAAIKLAEINTTSLSEAKLNELNGLVDEMIELAKQKNTYLDQYIESDVNADKIKEMLLESPYVPQEFKAVIMDLDSQVVRLLLEYILKGNSPEIFDLNTLNIGIMFSCINDIAKENGLTFDELINNSKNSGILRENLAKYSDVVDLIQGWEDLSNDDFQTQLKAFYYGDVSEEFPEQDVIATRQYVDYLAAACEVSHDELLNDSTYAETLKEGAVQFGKSLTFFTANSFFSDEGLSKNMTKLFNGSNYKAYGLNEDGVKSFRSEMDSIAKENNITTDKLLSDSQYADSVKDALLKSNSASGVGLIYKNADSTVSQNVAKNLYNTSFEESEQQKKLDELAQKAVGSTSESKDGVTVNTALSGEDKK